MRLENVIMFDVRNAARVMSVVARVRHECCIRVASCCAVL